MHVVVLFKDTATTEIYTLSLHDALPIVAASVANAMATESVAASVANETAIENAILKRNVLASVRNSARLIRESNSLRKKAKKKKPMNWLNKFVNEPLNTNATNVSGEKEAAKTEKKTLENTWQ